MINEAEYQAQMAKLLRRIEELDSATGGATTPALKQVERRMIAIEKQIDVMRHYLSRNIIHDLENVLTSGGFYLFSCKEEGKNPERRHLTLEARNLKGVLGKLEPSECDLRLDVIKPSLKGFYGNIRLGNGLKEGYKIFVPAGEIRARVVCNLLFNAAVHGTGNGIVFDFEGLEDGLYEVGVINGVKDVIPPDKLDSIFCGSRLNSKVKGSGLGLQNARNAMEKYGGRIGAESYVSSGPPKEYFPSGLSLFKVTFGLPKYR